jgi:Undecaprenyl-phosphate glucose phosphotransferase
MSDSAHVLSGRTFGELKFIRRISRRLTLPFYLVEPTVLMTDVALIIAASVASGIGYHWLFLDRMPDAVPYIAIGALAALNFSAIQLAFGGYHVTSLLNCKREIRDVVLTLCAVFAVLLSVAFCLKIGTEFSRGATFGFFGLGTILLVAWRGGLALLINGALAKGAFAQQRAIIITEYGALSHSPFASQLQSYGYVISAQFEIDAARLDGGPDKLREVLDGAVRLGREQDFAAVFLFLDWGNSACVDTIVDALSVLPVPVYLVPDARVVRYLAKPCGIGDIWTAELKRAPLNKCEQAVKRIMDVLGAALGILMLFPLMCVVAVLVKAESSGPIIFKQRRCGFNGRVFKIFKFRTMTVLEDGPVVQQARRDDSRFTSIGRWLRRTNIDELPQLFNVLFGQMSLVGPRPHAVAHDCEYEQEIATYAFRHNVKPGITGWAQFNGYRGETRTLDLMSKRVECDLWYIKHWSVWLDIKIIIGTVLKEMWRARGY